ncbi:MAG: lysoplasmalogenase [Caulobacteraceae bacterium]|nr:lysoplasmalogenase [Caulobacteraceae bacterium]
MKFETMVTGGSLAAALAYGLIFVERPPSLVKTVVKTLAVGLLALLVYVRGAPALLVAALGLSALGDAFLAGEPKTWLRHGLGAFLAAHLAYVWLFAADGGGRAAMIAEPVRALGVAGAFAAGVTMMSWLWASIGPLRPAVTVYAAALAAMVATAFTLPRFLWPAMPGAVLFLLSDAILSAELFKGLRSRLASHSVWGLYYAAQALITFAYLR